MTSRERQIATKARVAELEMEKRQLLEVNDRLVTINDRLVTIIVATGSGEYHGLLPQLISECIDSMTSKEAADQSAQSHITASFSFLYHLSSHESGAEALVNSGMVESLLTVIQKIGHQQDQIDPFEKMFKVLINIDYLKKVGTLGSSVDELMRHQNSFRKPAIPAAIYLLNYLVDLGNDPNTIIVKSLAGSSKEAPEEPAEPSTIDQETESEEEVVGRSRYQLVTPSEEEPVTVELLFQEKQPKKVPLLEYIVNVCKFLDSVLSNNNNTPDHCEEFISAGGVQVLLKLVSLESLPVDFPTSQAAQQVASFLPLVFVFSKEESLLEESVLESVEEVAKWLDKISQNNPQKPTQIQMTLKKSVGSKISQNPQKITKYLWVFGIFCGFCFVALFCVWAVFVFFVGCRP